MCILSPTNFILSYNTMWCSIHQNDNYTTIPVASYADALWARHAIFLPHVGEEYCVTSPKSVCVGGYNTSSGIKKRQPRTKLAGRVSLLTFGTHGVSGFKAYPLFPFSDLQTFFSSFSLSLDIFIFSLA